MFSHFSVGTLIKFQYIRFCLCFCMSDVISSFKSLRTGSQLFALLICVNLHTMWSGKSYASYPLVCCACLSSV